jgi:hypothetical protein
MDDIELAVPEPLGVPVTDDQARAVLEGLDPGWYATRTLWPRYLTLVAREGWPLSNRISLGSALKRVANKHQRVGSALAFKVEETTAGTDPAAEKEQP